VSAGSEGFGVAALRPAGVIKSFDGPVGAYVHVPFCEWIYPFCPYNKVVADNDLARRYFEALRREMDWYVEAHGEPFTSLYIGGGTPTLYPDESGGGDRADTGVG
jgi:oxygen-independent coproporphyrinogen-3 oxidase